MLEDKITKGKLVVVLNGPANSAKDCIAEYLSNTVNIHHKEFKKPLFDIAKAVAQISDDDWDMLYTREFKEVKTERLFGRSPREHMIHTSEQLIKPVYGSDYFGKIAALSLENGINIFSDSGFRDELEPIIQEVGSDNVLVIRLHRDGCSFDSDSRNYLYNTSCKEVDVYNNSTLHSLYTKINLEIINKLF